MTDRGRQLPITEGRKCPTVGCGGTYQFHSEAMWCPSCGWSKNRYPSPGEGYIERKIKL
jgi:hypothetical protein